VPLLVEHFVQNLRITEGKDIHGFAPDAFASLLDYDYPGNVRELHNVVEHAFVLCPGGMMKMEHLPLKFQSLVSTTAQQNLDSRLAVFEREIILRALKENNWNRLAAAEALGIHKTTLFKKIHKLGIALPEEDGRAARRSKQ
jgi:DNA-binding NtrC family response regulator